MDTLNAHEGDEMPGTPRESLRSDESQPFALEMTTRDFLDDLDNIAVGVGMNIGLHDAARFRQFLSQVLTVQECCRDRKLPAIAYISAHDITALDQIVDCFHQLGEEQDLTIAELEARAAILIRSFGLLLQELRAEYVK